MKTPTIKVLNAILRTDFHAFVQKVFETVSPNATYLDNWHIKLICSEISDMLAGNLIHKDWIHYYNELPDRMDRIFLSWDTASKVSANNAFSACSVIGIKKQKLYLLQIYRERLEFPALCRKIAELHEEYKTKYPSALITTLIEDASSGPSLAQQLRYEHGDMKVTLVKPDTDKITRLESVSSYIENGLILFPADVANWWQDFSSELFTFPNTTFKDQCDAFSQCLHVAAPIATKPAPRVFVL